jgi:hypothetical protein
MRDTAFVLIGKRVGHTLRKGMAGSQKSRTTGTALDFKLLGNLARAGCPIGK